MKKYILIMSFLVSLVSFADIKNDLLKASKYISENKVSEAKELFIDISKRNADNLEDKKLIEIALYNLGNIYLNENDVENAKEYYKKLSNNIEARTIYAINANQRLISIELENKNFEEAINQLEILNIRTLYSELPFVSNLIYMYETNNKIEKANRLRKTVISKLNDRDKGKLYNLVALLYFEAQNYEKSKLYYNKLLESKFIENQQLGYIGYSNIFLKENDKEKSILNLEIALNLESKNSVYILEQARIIYEKNEEYEKVYNILKLIEKEMPKDIGTKFMLIKITYKLENYKETEKYLSELENIGINSFDIALKLASENLIDYSEKYLLKAKKEGNKKSNDALINIYFGSLQEKKLNILLDELLSEKSIDIDKKENIIREFNHFKEYLRQKEGLENGI